MWASKWGVRIIELSIFSDVVEAVVVWVVWSIPSVSSEPSIWCSIFSVVEASIVSCKYCRSLSEFEVYNELIIIIATGHFVSDLNSFWFIFWSALSIVSEAVIVKYPK